MRNKILTLSFIAMFIVMIATSSNAFYTINATGANPDQDRATFIEMLNLYSTGGQWSLDAQNQLVFKADNNPINHFAFSLDFWNDNTANGRTVDVRQSYPGVLVGAYGPPIDPNGTQLLDLGDIQKFKVSIADEPLLDLQSSVMLHELSEVFVDGDANNYGAAHDQGIFDENLQLNDVNSIGQRLKGDIVVRDPITNVITQLKIPWVNTSAGLKGFEVITLNGADIQSVARGLADTGYIYDGTGGDIGITSITFEAATIPEPSTILLLGAGLVGVGLLRTRFKK